MGRWINKVGPPHVHDAPNAYDAVKDGAHKGSAWLCDCGDTLVLEFYSDQRDGDSWFWKVLPGKVDVPDAGT